MSFDGVNAHPLSWPRGRARTRAQDRKRAAFARIVQKRNSLGNSWKSREQATVYDATRRLYLELERLGVDDWNVVVSTNVALRQDGLPRSGQREPDDPGAAVYFQREGLDYVLACDRWYRVADNLIAIAKHIDALRGQERWGVGTLEEAFAGFVRLPETAGDAWWRSELGLGDAPLTRESIDSAFRLAAVLMHPDHGGTDAAMARVNAARSAALAALAVAPDAD